MNGFDCVMVADMIPGHRNAPDGDRVEVWTNGVTWYVQRGHRSSGPRVDVVDHRAARREFGKACREILARHSDHRMGWSMWTPWRGPTSGRVGPVGAAQ